MPGVRPQSQREATCSPGVQSGDEPSRHPALEVGTVLFFARPSLLQSWAQLFGHQWRHIGIIVDTDDGLRIASYGPKTGFHLDDPITFLPRYAKVGAARVLHTDLERERLNCWVKEFEGLDIASAPYVVSAPLVGPLHLLARRHLNSFWGRILMALVSGYCHVQTVRHRDRMAFVCSTFTWTALRIARDEPLRVPLSAHPDDAVAYAQPESTRDVYLSRWLCGPTEIWHAISASNRWNVDLSNWPVLSAGQESADASATTVSS